MNSIKQTNLSEVICELKNRESYKYTYVDNLENKYIDSITYIGNDRCDIEHENMDTGDVQYLKNISVYEVALNISKVNSF